MDWKNEFKTAVDTQPLVEDYYRDEIAKKGSGHWQRDGYEHQKPDPRPLLHAVLGKGAGYKNSEHNYDDSKRKQIAREAARVASKGSQHSYQDVGPHITDDNRDIVNSVKTLLTHSTRLAKSDSYDTDDTPVGRDRYGQTVRHGHVVKALTAMLTASGAVPTQSNKEHGGAYLSSVGIHPETGDLVANYSADDSWDEAKFSDGQAQSRQVKIA